MPLFARLFGTRARVSEAELELQRRSQAELKQGRLPLSAQERLASDDDELTFTSDLSVGDLTALRAIGHVPVGQAFGGAAYAVSRQFAYLDQTVYTTTMINRAVQVHGWLDGEIRAWDTAQKRLLQECRALGGDGVIGVRVLGTAGVNGVYDLSLVGTAVRQVGDGGRPEQPFLTVLSAPEFVALHRGGWRPTGLAVSKVCWTTGRYSQWAAGGRWGPTRELPGMTDLQRRPREQMRTQLEQRVRSRGGTGLLLHRFEVRLHRGDETLEAVGDALGTVIAPLPPFLTRGQELAPLPMMRLDASSAPSWGRMTR